MGCSIESTLMCALAMSRAMLRPVCMHRRCKQPSNFLNMVNRALYSREIPHPHTATHSQHTTALGPASGSADYLDS